MDARSLLEEHKAQVNLSTAVNKHSIQFARELGHNRLTDHDRALLKVLHDSLSNLAGIAPGEIIFTIAHADEKIAIVESNRRLIALANLVIINTSSTIELAQELYQAKSAFERLRTPKPYKYAEPLLKQFLEDKAIAEGLKYNLRAIQESQISAQLNLGK